jgi:hypothetical protein
MPMLKSRLTRLEKEQRFKDWLGYERFLEGLTEEQLAAVAAHWRFPEPMPPSLPWGSSKLDGLDRKSLLKLWQESERVFAGRSKVELGFYATHGHWRDQACDEQICLEAARGGPKTV